MNNNGFWSMMSIAMAAAIISACSFIDGCEKKQEIEPVPIVLIQTNQVDRAGQNVDWFKNTSNYIWDGWKIK